jgi:hypothetical protein
LKIQIENTVLKNNFIFIHKPIFKKALHPLIWSSFEELDKLYLKIYAGLGETVQLGSYDLPKYLDSKKKARGSKKYFRNISAYPGSIFFLFF